MRAMTSRIAGFLFTLGMTLMAAGFASGAYHVRAGGSFRNAWECWLTGGAILAAAVAAMAAE